MFVWFVCLFVWTFVWFFWSWTKSKRNRERSFNIELLCGCLKIRIWLSETEDSLARVMRVCGSIPLFNVYSAHKSVEIDQERRVRSKLHLGFRFLFSFAFLWWSWWFTCSQLIAQTPQKPRVVIGGGGGGVRWDTVFYISFLLFFLLCCFCLFSLKKQQQKNTEFQAW